MSAKAFKTLLVPDRYKLLTKFILSVAPLVTCIEDFLIQDNKFFTGVSGLTENLAMVTLTS